MGFFWGRGELDINRHRGLAALCCLLAGACQQGAPGKDRSRAAPRAPAPAIARAAAPSKPTGCSEAIQVALDTHSLVDAGDKPFPAARLQAFEGRAAAAFHKAADHACRATEAVRKALAPVRKLSVQSGSGATEPTFYRADEGEPGALVFQWVFNESGLDVPKRAEIETGLRCWADPHRTECADMGD